MLSGEVRYEGLLNGFACACALRPTRASPISPRRFSAALTRPQPPDLADVDLGPLPQRKSKAALLDDSDPIGPTSGADTNPQSQARLGRIENLDGRRPTPPSKSGGDQLIGVLNGHAGSIFSAWIGPISSRTTKVLSAIWISAFSDIHPLRSRKPCQNLRLRLPTY